MKRSIDNFVNRERELESLERWFEAPGGRFGIVWGRRRVGKTALLQEFAKIRETIFYTGGSWPRQKELALLSEVAAPVVNDEIRDLSISPFTDWDDVFRTIAQAARDRQILFVLDEFPELLKLSPELPSAIRAFWDHAKSNTQLRILLCGSAVRTMIALQEERAPLYGRADLSISLHPFTAHQAAVMLPGITPSERALVWGMFGGVPLYLSWWDQSQSVKQNLAQLICNPDSRVLFEGELVMATEGDEGDLVEPLVKALGAGKTKYNELAQELGTEPMRTLERLIKLRLVERIIPVTEDPRRTRRRLYQLADNFLAFWVSIIESKKPLIDRGIGKTLVPTILEELDQYMGKRWELAVTDHIVRLAAEERIAKGIVAVGPFWSRNNDVEIDTVALAGMKREAVLVCESKWAKKVDGAQLHRALAVKADALPKVADDLIFAIAAREEVKNAHGILPITAADIFDV